MSEQRSESLLSSANLQLQMSVITLLLLACGADHHAMLCSSCADCVPAFVDMITDNKYKKRESRVEVDNQPESRASFLPCFPQVQGLPMCSVSESCGQESAVSESKGDPCTDRSAAHRGITLWTVCTKPQSGDRETERWIGAGATLRPLLNHTCYSAFSFRLLIFFSCQIRSVTV